MESSNKKLHPLDFIFPSIIFLLFGLLFFGTVGAIFSSIFGLYFGIIMSTKYPSY